MVIANIEPADRTTFPHAFHWDRLQRVSCQGLLSSSIIILLFFFVITNLIELSLLAIINNEDIFKVAETSRRGIFFARLHSRRPQRPSHLASVKPLQITKQGGSKTNDQDQPFVHVENYDDVNGGGDDDHEWSDVSD